MSPASNSLRLLPLALSGLLCACAAATSDRSSHPAEGYALAHSTAIPGEGGWDDITVDADARRVYVSHATAVEVLDADTFALIGHIGELSGVHGIAIAPPIGQGFITNGTLDTVTVFDAKTLRIVAQVNTGKKPDAVVFEPVTQRVFAMNGDDRSATVIDAVTDKAVGTVALGGAPEFAVTDGHGHVFVNIEDKSRMLVLDARGMKVLKRYKLGACRSPSSLAMDTAHHRLFIGCRNKWLMVVDAGSGRIVAKFPIGDHVDATAYDSATGEVITTAGDGTLTVAKELGPDHYKVVQTINTPERSKTFGLDTKTHALFVPAAQFTPAPAATSDNPKPRPQVIPDTLRMLVFERQ